MKIGNVKLENNIFLAPMAGVTDLPFRVLCKNFGCGLVYSEMVSGKGIVYNNDNTKKLLEINEQEKPIAIQIFGSDPEILAEAARMIENYPFEILDINMGCPVSKVIKNGEGSALLKNPKLVGEIVRKVSDAIKKPVTVKIRKGFNNKNINAVEIAKIIEANGGQGIAIHGRTREEFYSGKADWNIIKEVKKELKIPVIGNGDIKSVLDAKNIFEQTNCDGIMIGRGAEGNPFIFKQILHFKKTGEILEEVSIKEKKETALQHLKMLTDFKGEETGVKEMRRHINNYTKGMSNSAKFRGETNYILTYQELVYAIEEFFI